MKDAIVTVFGGGGFVGRYVIQELFNAGARVRVAQRDPKSAFFLRRGRLGRIQFAAADVRRTASVARSVAGSDAIVNLVGVLKGDFQGFHVDGARNVAEAAAAMGVRTLVHLSAIGADPESPSRYARSKALGEEAVRKAFPEATILRPSIVFGREDDFTNRFARMLGMPIVPVVRSATRFQPVFAVDLAQAIARSVADPASHAGKTYEIAGSEQISMAQLLCRLAEWSGRAPHFADMPDTVAAAIARLGGWVPGAPITWDQWLMLQRDNIPGSGIQGLSAFGITPTPMAAVAPGWLIQYRKHGRFGALKATES